MISKRLKYLVLFLLSFQALANPTIKVGVIDTGLDLTDPRFKNLLCIQGHKDFTGRGLHDVSGHGTHVAGLIKEFAGKSKYCLVILKYWHDGATAGKTDVERMTEAIHYAKASNLDIVNISSSGPGGNALEAEIVKTFRGVFVVAAGNEGFNLDDECNIYPACYTTPNVMTVGSLSRTGTISYKSNRGKQVKHWETGENLYSTMPNGEYGMMSGTSQAAAVHTGKLIKRIWNELTR